MIIRRETSPSRDPSRAGEFIGTREDEFIQIIHILYIYDIFYIW